MNEKLEKIRQACIKANPEIVEKKLGCEVEVKYGGRLERAIYVDEASSNGGQIHFNPSTTYFLKHDIEGSIDVREISKIIGRKIGIADVLVAMQSIKDDNDNRHWIINRFGQFLNDNLSPLPKTHALVGVTWNLKDDDLNHQSEETIDFISELV